MEPVADRASAGPLRLPWAAPGDSTLSFRDGLSAQLVLRVLCSGPVELAVRQYGQRRTQPIFLPDGAARPLPDRGIEAGRSYAVREGYVVYWGGGIKEAFELRLSTDRGVAVSLNGHSLPIPPEMVGAWWLLDADQLPES
jgi:hypothetical protein